MSLLNDLAVSGLLPTPTANDAKNVTLPASQGIRKGGLPKKAMQNDEYRTGTGSRLNPCMWREMMGFPGNWLVSPFLGGAGKPSACGNAIVPQVALQIFETINEYERKMKNTYLQVFLFWNTDNCFMWYYIGEPYRSDCMGRNIGYSYYLRHCNWDSDNRNLRFVEAGG